MTVTMFHLSNETFIYISNLLALSLPNETSTLVTLAQRFLLENRELAAHVTF